MSNTLNEFVDLVEEAINDIFNNTILYSPVQNFLNCILIRKIEGIETALTWVMGPAECPSVNDAGSAATNGSGASASNSAASEPTVHRIVQGQLDSLRYQRNFFLIMLAV
ncbi:hypothetical protein CF326_g6686 [Tilletia indica]|nr:hypothetical protein CF326_g6686 [Tilletia indica]